MNESGETISTYGVTAYQIVDSVPNVFFDKVKAIKFIDLCNKKKLEPIHLKCVIEDLLYN